jgi:hypothetical protein
MLYLGEKITILTSLIYEKFIRKNPRITGNTKLF